MPLLTRVAGLLLPLTLLACGRPPLLEIPAGTVTDWPAYGATRGGTHFSRANQITPANVSHLEVAWEHRSGDIRKAGMGAQRYLPQSSLQVTPIVVEDRMYYCSPFNQVFALNAETGEQLWSYDPEVNRQDPLLTNCRGVSSWQSGQRGFCEHRILTGTLDARLIALDAETGKLCPDFGDGGEVDTSYGLSQHFPVEYAITSPPAILGDRVITGAQVLDNVRVDAPSGVVRAYDIRSGELLWVWNPVPPGSPKRNADPPECCRSDGPARDLDRYR